MLLSIVIPVYNVSQYIRKLCDTLFPQLAHDDIEVIIINDGSTDESMLILKERLSVFSSAKNVILLEQQNSGLSAARNTGIHHASGKYVTFIDSDDFVDDNYINCLRMNLNEDNEDIDVLTFNARVVDLEGNIRGDMDVITKNSIERQSIIVDVFNSGKWYAWCRVIKADIMKKNLFPVGKRFEDLLTFPEIYLKSARLKTIYQHLIYYRTNPDGISQNPKINDVRDVHDYLLLVIGELKSQKQVQLEYALLYVSVLKSLFYITNDYWGCIRSYLFINKYRFFSLYVFSRFFKSGIHNVSLNNIIFLTLNEVYFIKRNI